MEESSSKEKIAYVEPADFFPEDVRKKFGIGEYAKKKSDTAENEPEENKSSEKESK